jgi:hypothetical protein
LNTDQNLWPDQNPDICPCCQADIHIINSCVQKSMNLRRKTPGWKFDVEIRSCRVQMMQGFKTVAPWWTSPNRADYWAPPNAKKIMGL